MNKYLLILGAGGDGRVVKEVAEAMGVFDKIDFLDDEDSEVAIGKLSDSEKFAGEYSYAFPAFGDSELRMTWIAKLEENCYNTPVLIHPTAYISPSASVYPGSVVLPKAMVNTNSVIERGCIVGLGAIVDHDTFIGFGCHVDCGAIVKAHCMVKANTKIDSGAVYKRGDMPTPQEFMEANGFSFEVGV
ncbi:MAG: UDP-N-acetylbacillosamine N-acetyltransferase [Syntrophomonadaceae bacterium]|nr:UDP-N-acetylbacillosamine N-acetyltransferase [Bacillota bacterium]